MSGERRNFTNRPEVAAKIERDSNPAPDNHNEGQPLRRQEDDRGHQRSKLFTDCSNEHRESLNCINDNMGDKEPCQVFFDAYKKCRTAEHKRRLEENARISGKTDDEACVIC